MMSEGKSTVMETAMEPVMEPDWTSSSEASEAAVMGETGMSKTAAAMAKPAVSHAATTMTATTMTATAMHGRRRDHRTGCDGRRRDQRDHHFAQHDLSSLCCKEHRLPAWAPLVA
jgi:hypothetical protein